MVLGRPGPTNLHQHVTERQDAADAFASRLQGGFVVGFEARALSQREMVAELNLVRTKAPAAVINPKICQPVLR